MCVLPQVIVRYVPSERSSKACRSRVPLRISQSGKSNSDGPEHPAGASTVSTVLLRGSDVAGLEIPWFGESTSVLVLTEIIIANTVA